MLFIELKHINNYKNIMFVTKMYICIYKIWNNVVKYIITKVAAHWPTFSYSNLPFIMFSTLHIYIFYFIIFFEFYSLYFWLYITTVLYLSLILFTSRLNNNNLLFFIQNISFKSHEVCVSVFFCIFILFLQLFWAFHITCIIDMNIKIYYTQKFVWTIWVF